MKLYTDSSGKFQMHIPTNWEYKNPSLYYLQENHSPQSFGQYGKMLGAFQISCIEINNHIKELIKGRNEQIQSSDEKELKFTEIITKLERDEFYMFSCAVDDHYIFATYIITEKDRRFTKKYGEELKDVKKVLKSIKFIKPEFRKEVLALRRYDLFMTSLATTIDLMNKALEKGTFIEYVALSANRVDAMLRLSIILSDQIENKNNEIDTSYLFQSENDKPIMERNIYKQTLDKEIITKDIYDELESLYKERNKVIHRFIITDIRTEDILKITMKYHEVGNKIDKILNNLELKQSELKIGIHNNNSSLGKDFSKEQFDELLTKIRDKHGNLKIDSILGKKIK